ncbi:MAG: hypothetical protein ACI4AK_00375, partial [Lepagella sp.]
SLPSSSLLSLEPPLLESPLPRVSSLWRARFSAKRVPTLCPLRVLPPPGAEWRLLSSGGERSELFPLPPRGERSELFPPLPV